MNQPRNAAESGVIEVWHADAIGATAKTLAESLDPAALGAEFASGGNPVIPLVRHLREACAAGGVPAAVVHVGATSQNIIDAALMLLARRAGALVVENVLQAADAAATHAHTHRDFPMAASTLGQHALPTTFGALAAGWCQGLDRSAAAMQSRIDNLPVQFGGAAGTLAAPHPGWRLPTHLPTNSDSRVPPAVSRSGVDRAGIDGSRVRKGGRRVACRMGDYHRPSAAGGRCCRASGSEFVRLEGLS